MAQTKKILDRMQAVAATKQLTQAMKMVSVAKLGKAKRRFANETPYLTHYIDLFDEITASHRPLSISSVFQIRPVKSVLLICLTSNKGLCGAFNQHILKKVLKRYYAYEKSGIKVDILPIGQKGLDFLQRRESPCLPEYVDMSDENAPTKIKQMVDFLLSSFTKGTYDKVQVIYQPSRIATKESIRSMQLLPLIVSPTQEDTDAMHHYEPSREAIITKMVPEVLFSQLIRMWHLGSVAEHSVRMMVTSQATDKAEKRMKELKLSYNRSRQATITQSLSEIVAGADAMH